MSDRFSKLILNLKNETLANKNETFMKVVVTGSLEQMLSGLEAAGMNPQIAAGLVEMYAGVHSGILLEDYYRHKQTLMGKVKMTDFAKEFAAAF
jgi:hypothetical protein